MKRLFAIACILGLYGTASAQNELMLLTPDAKAIGMGGVTMTTLSASHTIYNNAAAPLFSGERSQIASTYFSQDNYNYYVVSGFYNFDGRNVLELGWRMFRRRHDDNDMTFDAGYARRIGERWSVALVAHYYHMKRPDRVYHALAADVNAMYSLPLENFGYYSTLRAGARLANLGAYFNAEGMTLPMNLGAGAALDTYITDAHEITLAADLGYYFTPDYVRGLQASFGVEYNLMQLFQIRGGYHVGQKKEYYPNYATVGAGVRFLHIKLDFAYIFAARSTALHNTYSISFGFDF